MFFSQKDLEIMVAESHIGSGLRELVRETTVHIEQRGINMASISGAVLVGGCTLCPPIRAILEQSFADLGLKLFDSPSEADRFAAVILGALRSVDAPVLNDYLLHDYALRLKAQNGNTIYQKLFPKDTVIPCLSDYTLHSSKRTTNQVGIRISVGELYRQPRQLPAGTVGSADAVPLVASDFRPLSTEGHLVVIPVDPAAPVGQRRYLISFGIDADRQLRITADDTVANKRLLDDVVISDLGESAPAPAAASSVPAIKPPSPGPQRSPRIL